MTGLVLGLYQLALTLLFPLILLGLGVGALRSPRLKVGFGERLGLWPRLEGGAIWVHAASLGEVRAVAPLILALKARGRALLVTSTSDTGRAEAKTLLGGEGRALILPVDHLLPLWLAFRRARPSALVVAETEIWPGLLSAARLFGVKTVVVSGRISDSSFPAYRRFRLLFGRALRLASAIQARTGEDAERYLALGAPKEIVTVGGDMKFDLPPPDGADNLAASLRRAKAGGWRVMVAGSVHPLEAALVFSAAKALQEGEVKLGLVVAPRHTEKLPVIEKEMADAGFEGVRWSALRQPLEASIIENFKAGRVIIVDRVGLLARLYGGAEVAFVGGSLVPVGGHNLLEPLNWGVPVLFGPHTHASAEVGGEVLRRGLGARVGNERDLASAAALYLRDEGARQRVKRAAREFFDANRGAVMNGLKAVEAAAGKGARN